MDESCLVVDNNIHDYNYMKCIFQKPIDYGWCSNTDIEVQGLSDSNNIDVLLTYNFHENASIRLVFYRYWGKSIS